MHNGTTILPIKELTKIRKSMSDNIQKFEKTITNSLSFALFYFSNSLNDDECYNS
jgi:hypothetical protein